MALAVARECFDEACWISWYNLTLSLIYFFICINPNTLKAEIFSFADKTKNNINLGTYCIAVSYFHMILPQNLMALFAPMA